MGSMKGKLIVMVTAVALASFWQGEEQVTYPGHFEQKMPLRPNQKPVPSF